MDWTRRVDELKQQVNDYWDNMQFTTDEAKRMGMSKQQYRELVYDDFVCELDQLLDEASQDYIIGRIVDLVETDWSES